MKPYVGVAGLQESGIWRARGLVALHIDAPPLAVVQHQMRVHLALILESSARRLQQLGLALRATLGHEGVHDGVAPLILHEFDPRGAHEIQHIALAQGFERNLRCPVEIANDLQLKIVARAYEAYIGQE